MPEERIYVIPLRGMKMVPRRKRAARAVKIIQDFLRRHMKSDTVKVDEALNRELWRRGAEKPPSRIRVRAEKRDDGVVEASLAG